MDSTSPLVDNAGKWASDPLLALFLSSIKDDAGSKLRTSSRSQLNSRANGRRQRT